MKENGMNKLIELLNEYEIEREEKIDLFNDKEKPLWEWYKDCAGYLTFEPTDNNKMNGEHFSGDTAHSVIISKSFGFIKWLVNKDKIDFDKLKPLTGVTEIMLATNCPDRIEVERRYRLYEQLIMLLSIQDNPISFLISILS